MPTYVYRCRPCDTTKEVRVSIRDAELGVSCEICGEAMSRDWASEHVTTNFHPSRDLYSEKLRLQGGKRNSNRAVSREM